MRYVGQISSTVGTLLILPWQALDIQDKPCRWVYGPQVTVQLDQAFWLCEAI